VAARLASAGDAALYRIDETGEPGSGYRTRRQLLVRAVGAGADEGLESFDRAMRQVADRAAAP
jgi:hypothetical protein